MSHYAPAWLQEPWIISSDMVFDTTHWDTCDFIGPSLALQPLGLYKIRNALNYKDNNKENNFGSSSLCFYPKPVQNINNRKVKSYGKSSLCLFDSMKQIRYFLVLLKIQKLLVGAFVGWKWWVDLVWSNWTNRKIENGLFLTALI